MTAITTAMIETEQAPRIPGELAEALLTEVATWGNVTTIIFAQGSVFEFKGSFPEGQNHSGFYNLEGPVPGLHGHLNLNVVDHIAFQDTPRRGKAAYALVFKTETDDIVFKIFLGRDERGEVLESQLNRFNELRAQYSTEQ